MKTKHFLGVSKSFLISKSRFYGLKPLVTINELKNHIRSCQRTRWGGGRSLDPKIQESDRLACSWTSRHQYAFRILNLVKQKRRWICLRLNLERSSVLPVQLAGFALGEVWSTEWRQVSTRHALGKQIHTMLLQCRGEGDGKVADFDKAARRQGFKRTKPTTQFSNQNFLSQQSPLNMPSVDLKSLAKASGIERLGRKSLTGTDMMFKHHNYGIGRTVAKKSWSKHSLKGDMADCHWLVTRVAPKKMVRPNAGRLELMQSGCGPFCEKNDKALISRLNCA